MKNCFISFLSGNSLPDQLNIGTRSAIKNIFFIVILLTGTIKDIHAQESVNTAGGDITGSNGSVSYSTGQVFNATYEGVNGSLSQGVQQPFEISVVTAIAQAKDIELIISAYPNPTHFLTLKVENFNGGNLSYQLFDMNGAVLQANTIKDILTQIEMINLPAAIYFLRVVDNTTEIKTFKIIKN